MTHPTHNLARLAERSLERHGDRRTLFFEGQWYGSGELHDRARRVAGGLTERGVRPGDRIAVMAANCPEVGIAYNAIWRAGAVVTPAIFLLPAEELAHVLTDSGAVAVVASSEVLDVARAGAASVEHGPLVLSTAEFAALEAAEPLALVERADDELAALMYTGGTTGRSKGVALSHESLWLAGAAAEEVGRVAGVNRALTALPLAHAFGLLVTVLAMHSAEPGTTALMRWFQPEAWLELVQEHRLQAAGVVPSMIQLLLAQPLEDYDLSSLVYLGSGGAALPTEVAEAFERRVPSCEVREGYGLTESAALLTSSRPGNVRRGAVGQPVPGVELRILDDDGAELPTGEVGEICARSPMLMQGYWNAPESTEDALRDGWLRTGDLGWVDEDSYLYVVDRKKDLIIRGGFNVFPRDVEEALLEHPSIAAAGVVGRPDELHGEEVVAFVELRAGIEPAELVAWSRHRIGGYKYPREVHVVPALPLTPVGKIDRKALRARLLTP